MSIDDNLLTGNEGDEIIALKAFLDVTVKIKDLGLVNYFLGLEVLKAKHGLLLTKGSLDWRW